MQFKGVILAVICWGGFVIGVNGQTINANQKSASKYQFEVLNLPDPDPNSNPGPSGYPDRHYRIFYSYGDGEYYTTTSNMDQFFPPTSASVNNTCTHEYLSLGSSVSYSPMALLFDRKTNNPPPSYVEFPPVPGVSIPMGTEDIPIDPIEYSMPIIDMSDSLNFCRRVGIDHSHFLEGEKWSSFILGYRPPPETSGAKLFFFYNDIFSDTSIYRPMYETLIQNGNLTIDNAGVYEIMRDQNQPTFDKVLIYDIGQAESGIDVDGDNVINGISVPEELRIFNFFKTLQLAQSDFVFLAVLGKLKSEVRGLDDCTASNWEEDQGFLANYITDNIGGPKTINNSAYVFVDADTIQLKNGDPKDPNSLVITDVCDCDGTYRVSFRLRYCNETQYPTVSSFIYIKDLAGIFSCFETLTGSFDNDNVNETSATSAKMQKCAGRGFQNGTLAQCHVEGYSIRKMPQQTVDDDSNCRVFDFTAQVDDIQELRSKMLQMNVMEACVNFHETDCELVCAKLDIIKETDSIPGVDLDDLSVDSNCTPPCKDCTSSCSVTTIALIGIAIILLLGLIFRKRIFSTGG